MIVKFLKHESAGGIVLMIAAALALLVANSPLYAQYHHVLERVIFHVGFEGPGGFSAQLEKTLLHWINDGLMALFFFVVGLEIKREIAEGQLSTLRQASLPLIAAIGGMAVPAAFFWFVNRDTPQFMHGWAISSATDIAFALGILSLLGRRVPASIKILLTAIAVLDDLGAIIIIAFFYTQTISLIPLIVAGIAIAVLFGMNRSGVRAIGPYAVVGLIMWAAVLESGVHATLAGVATALFIPLGASKNDKRDPNARLHHALHPWISFLIIPVFAFANAGVVLSGIGMETLVHPVTAGVATGLFAGKQLGIFLSIFAAVKLGLSPKPEGASWRHIYGLSLLCGIGFTMSLFIGGLAYDADLQNYVRLGVMGGSLLSALAGFVVLYLGARK